MAKWTADFSVEFVPLPEDMEEGYWEAIHYFAEILKKIVERESVSEVKNILKVPSFPAGNEDLQMEVYET